MKISKRERVYKFYDMEVTLRKLKLQEQKELSDHVFRAQSGVVSEIFDAGIFALKHCIVDFKGLVDEDGNEYKLQKDKNGFLTDETIEDLMSLPVSQQLISTAFQTASTTPDEILDEKGNPISEIKLKN